jgi:ATP-dependent Clp protease adaptor protein ClpS
MPGISRDSRYRTQGSDRAKDNGAMAEQKPTPSEPVTHSTGAAVRTQPRKPATDHLPPYRVLLHNDDVNTQEYVVDTIVDLTPLPHPRAVEVMLEADRTGVALLLITHREAAEFYQERFASKRLTVTIEPA